MEKYLSGGAPTIVGAPPIFCVLMPTLIDMRPAKAQPALWAPNGFAAIPTTILDPPHATASPMAPALTGPGPHGRQAATAG